MNEGAQVCLAFKIVAQGLGVWNAGIGFTVSGFGFRV
jgi:hypothetical protein